MGNQGTCRAKISVESVFLDTEGAIHITGEKDEYLLPADVEMMAFERVIKEDFKGQEMRLCIENSQDQFIKSKETVIAESRIIEYSKKIIFIGLFIIGAFFAVWLNDKFKDDIGIFATFLAGFTILASSILSIISLGWSSSRLQSNHN
jgi:hypothetical protein